MWPFPKRFLYVRKFFSIVKINKNWATKLLQSRVKFGFCKIFNSFFPNFKSGLMHFNKLQVDLGKMLIEIAFVRYRGFLWYIYTPLVSCIMIFFLFYITVLIKCMVVTIDTKLVCLWKLQLCKNCQKIDILMIPKMVEKNCHLFSPFL